MGFPNVKWIVSIVCNTEGLVAMAFSQVPQDIAEEVAHVFRRRGIEFINPSRS